MTTRPAVLPAETEAAFASWVHGALHIHGWRWVHFRPARTEKGWRTAGEGDIVGFPDIIATHPEHGGLAVELKADKGRETTEQIAWLNAFGWTGWRAEVWRPRDRAHALAVLRGEA